MQFRARTPNGKNSIVKLDENSATIEDLRNAIIKNVDDTKDGFTLSFGFPPQTVNLDAFTSDQTLSDAGLKLNNESVQVIPVVTGQKNSFLSCSSDFVQSRIIIYRHYQPETASSNIRESQTDHPNEDSPTTCCRLCTDDRPRCPVCAPC